MKALWKKIAVSVGIVVALFAGYSAYSGTTNDTSGPTKTPVERHVSVVVTPVSQREFEERLATQGNVEAKTLANVAARISGTIEKLFVDEGDRVVSGKTRLFQVDRVKLQRAVEIKRQDLAVARCALQEKEANLEQIDADLYKAEIDLKRYQDLYKDRAVSSDALEQQQSRHKKTTAMKKHALSLIQLAKEQVRQAEIVLSIAQKDLSDSLIYAPISGTVSSKYQEVGEMAELGKLVLRIEDTSIVEVSAFLPAQFYTRIHTGKTPVQIKVSGVEIGTHAVSYKSPVIDPKVRTFEIKVLLKNPPQGVVPGAMATASVLLVQRKGLGVPAEVIQQRSGNSVVFMIENKQACMVEVKTGLETDGYVELMGNALPKGTPVVTRGQVFLNQGTPVTVTEEGS